MQEIMLEDQLRSQLSISNIQEQQALIQQQNQNRKQRRVKKALPKPDDGQQMNIGETLKNEIELLPTKTPISILQELLSRRGNFDYSYIKKNY
jgi:hypothetical protein